MLLIALAISGGLSYAATGSQTAVSTVKRVLGVSAERGLVLRSETAGADQYGPVSPPAGAPIDSGVLSGRSALAGNGGDEPNQSVLADTLPFTGAPLWAFVALGLLILTASLLLRRRVAKARSRP